MQPKLARICTINGIDGVRRQVNPQLVSTRTRSVVSPLCDHTIVIIATDIVIQGAGGCSVAFDRPCNHFETRSKVRNYNFSSKCHHQSVGLFIILFNIKGKPQIDSLASKVELGSSGAKISAM